MAGASKEQGSKRKGAKALEYVKTQQRTEAELAKQAATAKEKKASRPVEGAGDPSHDSPKRQGDKLEKATRAAAGRSRRE